MYPEVDDPNELPEFERLAAQLSQEASELSHMFPARTESDRSVPAAANAPRSATHWLKWLAAGSAAAVLVGLSAHLGPIGSNQDEARPNVSTVVAASDTESTPSLAEANSNGKELVSPPPQGPVVESIPVYPVGFTIPAPGEASQLSGPEWEAVLDLTSPQQWEGVELSL